MKNFPQGFKELLNRYASTKNCVPRINWYDYTYDFECGNNRYLVKRVTRRGTVTFTYKQYIEASRAKPTVILYVYDPNTRFLSYVEFPWQTIVDLIEGVSNKKYFIITEPGKAHALRVRLVGMRSGVNVCMVLDKKTAEKLFNLKRRSRLSWNEFIRKLIESYI